MKAARLAHGNINFLSDGKGQIHAINVWNTDPRSRRRTWGAVIRVSDMRTFLLRFVELVEERHRTHGWYGRSAA